MCHFNLRPTFETGKPRTSIRALTLMGTFTFPYLYSKLSTVEPKKNTFSSSFLPLSWTRQQQVEENRKKTITSRIVCVTRYSEAGVHHSVIPRQAEVHGAAQRAPQPLAHQAEGHADVPLLHLPVQRPPSVPVSPARSCLRQQRGSALLDFPRHDFAGVLHPSQGDVHPQDFIGSLEKA